MVMMMINLFFLGGNLKANHLLSKAAGRNKHDPPLHTVYTSTLSLLAVNPFWINGSYQ